MATFRLMGLFALIPTALLLTVSFFVLFVIRRTQEEGLKAFGYVIATLLWIGAALVFSFGVYTMATGRHPMMAMMQQMMKCKMQGMMPPMDQSMMKK